MYAHRYVATVVAIVVGVGFIITIDALASAVRGGLLADSTAQYVDTGTVVSQVPDVAVAARVLQRLPGTATVNAQMTQPLAVDGRNVTAAGQVATVATEPALRWQHLTAGRFPTGPGQALADVNAARQARCTSVTASPSDAARTRGRCG
jgi:putative ABC transport system permease protein